MRVYPIKEGARFFLYAGFLGIFALFLPPGAAAQKTDVYYFSPGTDSEKKQLVVPFSVNDSRFIKSWRFTVTDAAGKSVFSKGDELPAIQERPSNFKNILAAFFKPKQSVSVPKFVVWNGTNDAGAKCPDGTYFFYFSASDDNNNYGETQRYRAVIDTVRPAVTITQPAPAAKSFGNAARPSFAVQQSGGSREDRWTAAIKDEAGKTVRTFEWRDAAPASFSWDGKDDKGITLADGLYEYSISAIDAAGNKSLPAEITGIRLESVTPQAEAGRAVAELAPNGKTRSQTFNLKATTLQSGIASWRFEIISVENGALAKKWEGNNSPRSQIEWNGKGDDGVIAEGKFKGVLTIQYTQGASVSAETPEFFCTGLPPELKVTTTPPRFSPDGDGENDVLSIQLGVKSVLPVAAWTLIINDPTGKPFKSWTGKSEIPAKLEWNGKGDNGETVESAMEYPFVMNIADSQEQTASADGKIQVDVLVMREGDRYILRVPAIIFRANNADFESKAVDRKRGLEQSVIDNNVRVLTRVAEILQKFSGYRVTIEGHANSETGKPAEEEELIPLSKRRAEFVKTWLVEHGVSGARLTAEGVGGKRPVMANRKDRDSWWKNRRVEFVLQR